jgi:hypothetical protein
LLRCARNDRFSVEKLLKEYVGHDTSVMSRKYLYKILFSSVSWYRCVIPAKAVIQGVFDLDSGLRGSDIHFATFL